VRRRELEELAKTIEGLRLHISRQPTPAKSAEWLHGQQEGWEQALKYAARTLRTLAEEVDSKGELV
jgi:hypothetical protein